MSILELIHDETPPARVVACAWQRPHLFGGAVGAESEQAKRASAFAAGRAPTSVYLINWPVVYMTTVVATGNGELGFDSGEGA